ncbi:hypothetical protein [Tropicimonas isoalkanivorans]|uniref:Uncharacterized protein n=1 Tax=Tropicimonas isoalkanivorans TaxID=441112 RepID=A0A1I1N4W4_9RHOB|nr:hypothetical protein [Tropicimonas isoalkanivorans]SFC89863.1 hypothetical protein SAMN04488094_11110 [Tropicimonas isoalkanivorans]
MSATLELIWRVRKNRFGGRFGAYHEHLEFAEDWLVRKVNAAPGDLMMLVADCHADATRIDMYWAPPSALEGDRNLAVAYARRHLVDAFPFGDGLTRCSSLPGIVGTELPKESTVALHRQGRSYRSHASPTCRQRGCLPDTPSLH